MALLDALVPLADPRLLAICGGITLMVLATIPFEAYFTPLARKFRIDNPYINYPITPDHVPVSLLAFLSLLLPFAFILLAGIFDRSMRKHSVLSVVGLLAAISFTMLFTDILKILIGNQRPDFIARCQPRSDAPRDVYVTVQEVCTQTDLMLLWEGCKSTPSGHSALSFAGLGFLSLWIVFTFDLLGARRPIYLKASGFTPLLIAGYIAFSRIIDHKHHWLDVISGSIIGAGVAYGAYTYVVRDSGAERTPNYTPV